MSLQVEAIYEGGVLKFPKPLPLSEHQRVIVTIQTKTNRVEQSYGLIHWTGEPEALRKIAEDDEYGVMESP